MDFDAVSLLYQEREQQTNLFQKMIENINNNLSTLNCEYVDNLNNMYSNIQNIAKTSNLSENFNVSNFTETFQKDYSNVINNTVFADKYRGLRGYVENFVDNTVKAEDFSKVIHNNYDFLENLKNDSTSVSNEYKNLNNEIRNIENSANYETNKYGININMGGITQHISNTNADTVMDMLIDKLQNTISSCSNRAYY